MIVYDRDCSPLHKTTDLEKAAEEAGLPFAIIHSEESWQTTAQGRHMSKLPTVTSKTVPTSAPPKPLSPNPKRPLEGLKVLCVTHAIAGPSAGRTLAEHGASVLQIMYTHGFEHSFVYTYANLGCESSRLNFNKASDLDQMWRLICDADVWIDSYRDGAMSKFGFSDEGLLAANPGLIISHVRLYGTTGPWASKPGFEMQGSASSGMMAYCGNGVEAPRWPPGQVINDYTTGYFGALAIQAAVLRRMREGGGYILSPSLCKTAMTILKHFKTTQWPELASSTGTALPPDELELQTGVGLLKTLRPLPRLDQTPISYGTTVLGPMGSALPVFPGDERAFDVHGVSSMRKEDVVKSMQQSVDRRARTLRDVADQFD